MRRQMRPAPAEQRAERLLQQTAGPRPRGAPAPAGLAPCSARYRRPERCNMAPRYRCVPVPRPQLAARRRCHGSQRARRTPATLGARAADIGGNGELGVSSKGSDQASLRRPCHSRLRRCPCRPDTGPGSTSSIGSPPSRSSVSTSSSTSDVSSCCMSTSWESSTGNLVIPLVGGRDGSDGARLPRRQPSHRAPSTQHIITSSTNGSCP